MRSPWVQDLGPIRSTKPFNLSAPDWQSRAFDTAGGRLMCVECADDRRQYAPTRCPMQWLKRGRRSAVLLWFVTPIALFEAGPLRAEETALDRYVAKPDATYAWHVVRTVPAPG